MHHFKPETFQSLKRQQVLGLALKSTSNRVIIDSFCLVRRGVDSLCGSLFWKVFFFFEAALAHLHIMQEWTADLSGLTFKPCWFCIFKTCRAWKRIFIPILYGVPSFKRSNSQIEVKLLKPCLQTWPTVKQRLDGVDDMQQKAPAGPEARLPWWGAKLWFRVTDSFRWARRVPCLFEAELRLPAAPCFRFTLQRNANMLGNPTHMTSTGATAGALGPHVQSRSAEWANESASHVEHSLSDNMSWAKKKNQRKKRAEWSVSLLKAPF